MHKRLYRTVERLLETIDDSSGGEAMLREVLTTRRGEAEGFAERFAQSASTFAGMAAIEDIRELRQALAREVETLKKIVAGQQKHKSKITLTDAEIASVAGFMSTGK